MNRTWFVLGSQMCDGKLNQTALLAIWGPYQEGEELQEDYEHGKHYRTLYAAPDDSARVFMASEDLDKIFVGADISMYKLAWDWTCNIVVEAPTFKDGYAKYITLQISDYDGQVRPQTNTLEDHGCTDCWGPAAKSFSVLNNDGSYFASRSFGEENCGDKCAFITV